ncbi:hypothetical protein CR513_62658, partial [Mucuna pruriens]
MRCKKHLQDLTSTIGVCASCLRERLQPLLAAQVKAQGKAQDDSDNHRHRKSKPEPKPEPNPLPLNFPRSVSPYVAQRKSDRRERMFFGTPQVGAVASSKRKVGGKFWSLSNLFKARSNKTETSPRESSEEQSSSAASPPPSWFSTILAARRHGGIDRRRCRNTNRELSHAPAAENHADEVDATSSQNRSDSGCSSGSSPLKQLPTPAANRRSRFGGGGKGLTSMAFCLSPLVRASPNRHFSHKGLAQELGAGGAHRISTAASLCANRSRKFADFGRVAHNR